MKFSYILSLLPAVAFAAPTAMEPRAPAANPASVSIRGIAYGGSGCPQGSLKVGVAQNGTLFALIFDKFAASAGPGVAIDETRKNCQLNFDVIYSPGFQYQVFSAEYRGYAQLDSGSAGILSTNYYFSGQTDTESTSSTINGPFSGTYTKRTEKSIVTWSPCGSEAMLNVNTAVRITTTGSSGGYMAVDTANNKFTQWIYVRWQAC